MAIDYFQIKEKDFDLVKQIIDIEAESYGEDNSLGAFDIIAYLRHARVYVAVENETVLGYIIYTKDFDINERAYLHSINIVDTAKYPKLGAALIDITLGDLASFGIREVEVNVDPANSNALRKYKDELGFSLCDRLESDIFENGRILTFRKAL